VTKQRIQVELDPEDLARLDEAAARLGVSRSRLAAFAIEEWLEDEEAAAWVAEHEEAALAEPRVPWEEVKAELGL